MTLAAMFIKLLVLPVLLDKLSVLPVLLVMLFAKFVVF